MVIVMLCICMLLSCVCADVCGIVMGAGLGGCAECPDIALLDIPDMSMADPTISRNSSSEPEVQNAIICHHCQGLGNES